MSTNGMVSDNAASKSGLHEETLEIVTSRPRDHTDNETRNRHLILYRAALKGDWNTAKKIYDKHRHDISAKISKEGDTALHIASAEGHTNFVKELLERMDDKGLAMKNNAGNTAFFLYVAFGEKKIAEAMIRKNGDLATSRGNGKMLPINRAAFFGNKKMVRFLYDEVEKVDSFGDTNDRIELLFTTINNGFYDIALKLVEKYPELATARDKNEETALHSLAKISLNQKQYLKVLTPFVSVTSKDMLSTALDLVKFLWKEVTRLHDSNISEIIRKPWSLIFVAAKEGNIAFLNIIFDAYPDLIFEVDENNYSIFHVAALYRHRNIIKLMHERNTIKDFVSQKTDKEGNNILHLAAGLAPPDRHNLPSEPAFQLRMDISWFKKVRKILPPFVAEAQNKEGKTPRTIFTEQHATLKENAEKWLTEAANSCLMAATIVATMSFAAIFTVPGGTEQDTGSPNFVQETSFKVFAVSDAISLMSSCCAILTFLSISTSQFAEADYNWWLPSQLIIAFGSLCSSVTALMVVFCATTFIVFKDEIRWIPILVSIMASMAVSHFIFHKAVLLHHVVREYKTYFSCSIRRSLFPSKKRESSRA